MSKPTNSITTVPGLRGGRPVLRGMRITVADVLGWLASGTSEAEILEDFPELTQADIRAALAFAAERERSTVIAVEVDDELLARARDLEVDLRHAFELGLRSKIRTAEVVRDLDDTSAEDVTDERNRLSAMRELLAQRQAGRFVSLDEGERRTQQMIARKKAEGPSDDNV